MAWRSPRPRCGATALRAHRHLRGRGAHLGAVREHPRRNTPRSSSSTSAETAARAHRPQQRDRRHLLLPRDRRYPNTLRHGLGAPTTTTTGSRPPWWRRQLPGLPQADPGCTPPDRPAADLRILALVPISRAGCPLHRGRRGRLPAFTRRAVLRMSATEPCDNGFASPRATRGRALRGVPPTGSPRPLGRAGLVREPPERGRGRARRQPGRGQRLRRIHRLLRGLLRHRMRGLLRDRPPRGRAARHRPGPAGLHGRRRLPPRRRGVHLRGVPRRGRGLLRGLWVD